MKTEIYYGASEKEFINILLEQYEKDPNSFLKAKEIAVILGKMKEGEDKKSVINGIQSLRGRINKKKKQGAYYWIYSCKDGYTLKESVYNKYRQAIMTKKMGCGNIKNHKKVIKECNLGIEKDFKAIDVFEKRGEL